MKQSLARFQIGKQGLTDGVLNSLKMALQNHRQVRISILKSCCRDKTELKKIAEKIESKMPYELKVRIIGYTLVLVKLSNKEIVKIKFRKK